VANLKFEHADKALQGGALPEKPGNNTLINRKQ